jgi:TonB family protein
MMTGSISWASIICLLGFASAGCAKTSERVQASADDRRDYTGFVKFSEDGFRKLALERPTPVYPKSSVAALSQGVVVVDVKVEADGHVLSVEVQEAPDASIKEEAAQTLMRWRFRILRLPGATRDSRMTSRLIFYYDLENGQGVVRTAAEKTIWTAHHDVR